MVRFDDYLNCKSRFFWIDIAKGIAIILMIIGHTVTLGGYLRNWIFSFHMPLFFLLSGYTIQTVSWEKMGKATIKDYKRLIVPVLVMRGINAVVNIVIDGIGLKASIIDNISRILWGNGNDYIRGGRTQFLGLGVIWFLIALFWSKLFYRLLLHIQDKYRILLLICFSGLGMYIGKQVRLPQCLDIIPVAMLFMEGGYSFRKYKDKMKEKVKRNLRTIVYILTVSLWIWLACIKRIYIEIAVRQYPCYFICIIVAFIGCFCMLEFSMLIEKQQIHFNSRFLSFVGQNSLDLLCIHHIDNYMNNIAHWSNIDNDIFRAIVRTCLDLIVLFVWVIIKNKIKEKIKSKSIA